MGLEIVRAGLDPADFQWIERRFRAGRASEYMADSLVYRPAGQPEAPEVYFTFTRDAVLFSPGTYDLHEQHVAHLWEREVLPYVTDWLENIKRESGPSLWEGLAQTKLTAIPNTPFTRNEQAAILARLDEMNQQIGALDALTRDQKQLLSAELPRIKNALRTMGRAEWLRFAIGSMLVALASFDIQHSVAASLARWASSAFHSMATGTPLPPLLLP